MELQFIQLTDIFRAFNKKHKPGRHSADARSLCRQRLDDSPSIDVSNDSQGDPRFWGADTLVYELLLHAVCQVCEHACVCLCVCLHECLIRPESGRRNNGIPVLGAPGGCGNPIPNQASLAHRVPGTPCASASLRRHGPE